MPSMAGWLHAAWHGRISQKPPLSIFSAPASPQNAHQQSIFRRFTVFSNNNRVEGVPTPLMPRLIQGINPSPRGGGAPVAEAEPTTL